MPSIQPAPFLTSSPASTSGQIRQGVKDRPVRQATLLNGTDSIRFGHQQPKQADESEQEAAFTTGEKWKGGGKALLKSVADWKWWAKEGAIACGITLATCWLPGSQLFTIPLWLGISGAFKHGRAFMEGFRNPDFVDDTSETESSKPAKHASNQDADHEEWTRGEKAKAAFKGAWQEGIKAVSWKKDGDLMKNMAFAGLITLATCWLPGSQLLTIPAWFCIDAAIKAGQGAYLGWQHPGLFNNEKSTDDLEKGRKA